MLSDLPRELVFHGIYVPTVAVLFIVAAVLTWLLDYALALFGVYRFAWHPSLFRFCVFACVFCGISLFVYR